VNAHDEALEFMLPEGPWNALLDTARAAVAATQKSYPLEGHSLVLLARPSSTAPARTDE
jgi:hypothetical protein